MGTGDRHVDAAQAQGTHHSGIGPPLTGDVLWAGGKSGICCCFQEMLEPCARQSLPAPPLLSASLEVTGNIPPGGHHSPRTPGLSSTQTHMHCQYQRVSQCEPPAGPSAPSTSASSAQGGGRSTATRAGKGKRKDGKGEERGNEKRRTEWSREGRDTASRNC